MSTNKNTNSTDIELRNSGLIILCDKIETDTIKNTVKELVYMNSLEERDYKHIQLILNSTGGELHSSFMLTDFIEFSKIPIHITGLGICASVGILILCSGEKGQRIITKNTSLLSHQYTWGFNDKYHDLIAARKEQDLIQERMIRHYLKHTKLDRGKIKEILLPESDVWLSPKEAKKYGLIDRIV